MAARRNARIIVRDRFCTIQPKASAWRIVSILLKLFRGKRRCRRKLRPNG
jgi:hypothetical protein